MFYCMFYITVLSITPHRHTNIICQVYLFSCYETRKKGGPRGVIVKAMDCGIVVSEFVFQSHYYVYFRENTLGKGMNPLILPAMG